MKHNLFSGLLLSLVITTANAQNAEPALARVFYEFTHINDTLQPDKPHKEDMVLYLGRQGSLYASYAGERANQQVRKQMEDPGFDGNIVITGAGGTPAAYYAVPAAQQLRQVYNLMGERYLLEEDYPAIDWQLEGETREIDGYTAQRATGHFKGRHYTAWFTAELPFQAGPWKLLGLPGLVLEATDERRQVVFRYAGFETLEGGKVSVALPEGTTPTAKAALDKLIEAFKKNPQAAMNARAGAAGGAAPIGGNSAVMVRSAGGQAVSPGSSPALDPSSIKSISVKRDLSQTSPVINNPMELED